MSEVFKSAIATAITLSEGNPAKFKKMAMQATGLTVTGFNGVSITSKAYKALKAGQDVESVISDIVYA